MFKIMNLLKKIKDFISGYKTYFICLIAIVGALVAWSEGAMSTVELYQAIVAALAGITIRAAVTKSGNPA